MPEDFPDVDHLVLNEAELTLPLFLEDLERGKAQRVYTSDRWADIEQTPIPQWEMVNKRNYASMNIQYSRGCPFNCEFCNITVLYGQNAEDEEHGSDYRGIEPSLSDRLEGKSLFR